MMATVEDPWAARIAAAAMKGSHNPIVIEDMPLPIISAMPEFCSTLPNAPPAPVIRIIMAAARIASPTQPDEREHTLSNGSGKRHGNANTDQQGNHREYRQS